MATVTRTVLSTVVSSVSSTASASSTAVAEQAGILEGSSPTVYNASNPIILFIIQVGIVLVFCQLLHYPLRLLNQPRVIAEVIGGILLGPSVMMRIPGFENAIFPTASMPIFNAAANLGLIVFLFLVGLEVDVRLFAHNWQAALSVGLASMVLPFGLGFAIAWGLFNQFHDDGTTVSISFGVYGLFIGTAMAITAFPVLCRILTELKLLRSNVGVTVLAAGVGNDVTGWILLALCVALVNNSSGLAALWALLCCLAWVLFLVFAVRPVFIWLLRRTGSLHNGPTQGMVALTLLLALTSAWFTGIVGIHPIFGAFLVGLICPHDGGFAIKLTEKVEDVISVLLLPLYFAYSGLSTNLGLLNDGITWAYVVGVIACAFSGKIIGGTLAARANKLLWRESFSIGCLMSCKGLVELIVLNIGLQARILSQRTFTIFVVMALVTTVATTPLTKALYPTWYQIKVDRWRRGEIDWDGNPTDESSSRGSMENLSAHKIRRLLVQLRLDSLPSLFTFISLLGSETNTVEAGGEDTAAQPQEVEAMRIRKRPLEVHGLRLVELTQRTSSVMHVTEGEEFNSLRDPVVNAFRAFSQLHDVAVSGRVAVVPADSYAETLMAQASAVSTDFALIPWTEAGSITDDESVMFPSHQQLQQQERFRNSAQLQFMQSALQRAARTCNTGIFVDNGFGGVVTTTAAAAAATDKPRLARSRSAASVHSQPLPAPPVLDKSHHVFLPFLGGADDRAALRFVLQLARNPLVTATIIHVALPDRDDEAEPDLGAKVVDEIVSVQDLALLSMLRTDMPAELAGRVAFSEISLPAEPPTASSSSAPSPAAAAALAATLDAAQRAVGLNPRNAGDIVVVGRRHALLGDADIDAAATSSSSSSSSANDVRRTLGVVAETMVLQGVRASVLIVQAGGREG